MHWLTRNSSSYHTLDPYQGLSHPKKLLYLGANWLNNHLPRAFTKQLFTVQPLRQVDPKTDFAFFQPEDSLARKLSNIFWMHLPWKEIQAELNGEIHAFDIGCGAGNYGPFLEKHSGECLSSYTGIDVEARPNWDTLSTARPGFFHFHRFQGQDIRPFLSEKTNFILSQSALEHIPEDLTFFQQLNAFIENRKQPTIQVHLFPATATFDLYPFHGIRQYSPKAISTLVQCFDPSHTTVQVYALGGTQSIQVHKKYLLSGFLKRTKDRRKANLADYTRESEAAISADVRTDQTNNPLFYALVIHSYPTTSLPQL